MTVDFSPLWALKLREDTVALRKTKLGLHHPYTLRCRNDLGASYLNLGRPADALQLFEETLARSCWPS